jgi:acyl-CoA ligase (AMP-forming) (exosortase A-associated)
MSSPVPPDRDRDASADRPFALDRLVLRGAPAAVALRTGGQTLSFDALNLHVGRMAARLRAGGLKSGDRVASWAAKGHLTCLLPLAAARAGLIHVPVNPLLKRGQVAHILADSGARLLVATAARLATLAPGDVPDDCATAAEADWADDPASDALPPSPADADTSALAAILYTSGSTGRPKGVMLSHANLSLGALSVASYLGLSDDDVTLAVLPLAFDYGQNQLLAAWAAGGSAVPLDYLTPRDVVKAVARGGITTLAAVPPLWLQLAETDWPADAVAPLRRLTNSGGALTPALVRRLRALFPEARLFAMYGLTEAFRSTYLDPALIDAHPTSIGRAIPFAEVMVVRPDGARAAADEPGELVHAGPLVAAGYWRDPVRTAERFRPAPPWSVLGGQAVWSGDTVVADADGLLRFVGRDDAMLKVSGNRISPTEIEEAAMASGRVAEAVALGRPDARTGQAILLVARAAGNPDEEGLRAYLKQALPGFMQPAEILWRDALPRNANGKLDRAGLAAECVP